MAALKRVYSTNLTNGSLNCEIPKGTFKNLVFQFEGVAVDGQTVTSADLGNLRIFTRNGDICGSVPISDIMNINNYEYGILQNVSNPGGTFSFQVIFDFGFPDDNEFAMKFVVGDNGNIQILFANTLQAKISSGICVVYTNPAKGKTKYIRGLYSWNQTLAAAGSTYNNFLKVQNVNSFYFRQASDFSDCLIMKDSFQIVNASSNALLQNTSFTGRIENPITFVYIDFNPTHSPAEIISSEINLQLTSAIVGGGNIVILYHQIIFDPAKLAQSTQSLVNFSNQQIIKQPAVQQTLQIIRSPVTPSPSVLPSPPIQSGNYNAS